MRQDETGNSIRKIRDERGLTQQELSDKSGIDIRTIQRCEAGQVKPRQSTLRILSEVLECDLSVLNVKVNNSLKKTHIALIRLAILSGLFYYIIFLMTNFPTLIDSNHSMMMDFLLKLGYMIFGVFLFNGFLLVGKNEAIPALKASAIISMICILLFAILALANDNTPYAGFYYALRICGVIFGVNSIAFGIGLLRIEGGNAFLSRITGILQLMIAPLIIIPLSISNQAGLFLSALLIPLLLITLLYWQRVFKID